MNYFISIKTVINKSTNKSIPVSIGLVSEEGRELYLIIEDNVNPDNVSIKDKEMILDKLEPKGSINKFIFNNESLQYQTWQSYENVSQNVRGFLSKSNKENHLWGFNTILSNPSYIELVGGLNNTITDYPAFIYDIYQFLKINEIIGMESELDNFLGEDNNIPYLRNINNNYSTIIPQIDSNEFNALGEAALIKMMFMNSDCECGSDKDIEQNSDILEGD